jgi:HK97 family phage portal protein
MVTNAKATVANALAYVPSWLKVHFVPATFQRLAKDGYKASAVVYACVTRYALSFQEPPLRLYDEASNKPVLKHPMLDLLKKPNDWMNQARLMVHIIIYMVLGGDCFVYKLRARDGRIVGLRPLHAGQMVPVPSVTNFIESYLYTTGDGTQVTVDASDVIQIQWPAVDPEAPERSYPPLLAVAREVDTAAEAARYTYALFKNDAAPLTAITFPAESKGKDIDYQSVKDRANERMGGEARGSLIVLKGGAKIERIGLNLKELDSEQALNVPEAHIASAFMIPPIILGLNIGLRRSTFANYGEARSAFTQDVLCPLWRHVADALTLGLQSEFTGRPVRVEFDLTRVEALRDNQAEVHTQTNAVWLSGLITRNEGRVRIGEEELDDAEGDVYIYDVNPGAATPAGTVPEVKPKPAATPAAEDPETDTEDTKD